VSKESTARSAKDWSGVVKKRLMVESVFCVVDVAEPYGCGMALAGDMLANISPRGSPSSEATGRKRATKLPKSPLPESSLLMEI
jgi:hypothetical protein